jgi:hypothetical protein
VDFHFEDVMRAKKQSGGAVWEEEMDLTEGNEGNEA